MNLRIRLARRIIKSQWRSFQRLELNDKRLSEEERNLIKLIKRKSGKTDIEFLVAPLSNKRYIVDKFNKTFIIMENNTFWIISSSSKLRYVLPNNASEYVWRFVDKQIEKKRMKFEDEIRKMMEASLNYLLK